MYKISLNFIRVCLCSCACGHETREAHYAIDAIASHGMCVCEHVCTFTPTLFHTLPVSDCWVAVVWNCWNGFNSISFHFIISFCFFVDGINSIWEHPQIIFFFKYYFLCVLISIGLFFVWTKRIRWHLLPLRDRKISTAFKITTESFGMWTSLSLTTVNSTYSFLYRFFPV